MNETDPLARLEEAVFLRNADEVSGVIRVFESEKKDFQDILKALSRGIERAREQFKKGVFSIPDFLLSIDAYRMGVDLLKTRIQDPAQADPDLPQIVIGVVEGDVHDMGKNIVAAVLEACGYTVHDLGRNVPAEKFIDALKQTNAGILALSAMMSTALDAMADLTSMVKRLFPHVAVIVGGAPFDADLARRIGADGYAENAIATPDETRRVLALTASAAALIK
jgi:dimethylamine corrinoid protein